MTKRTRYFILTASLVMVASLCTGLVAYYSGGLPLMASRTAPGDLSYVPGDATVVGFANVRDIMNSEFRQKLRTVFPTGEGRDEFLAETGIDLERDVISVVAATSASTHSGIEDNGLLIVRGVFSQTQIEAAARTHGATTQDYKGIRMLVMTPNQNATQAPQAASPAVAFLENGLVGIGKLATLQGAIDAHKGANVTANAEVMRLIGDIDAGNNAWLVGRLDEMSKVADLPAQVKAQMPAVNWFAVTGRVNGGINGSVRAEARDDQSAENLRDVVRGALALARLQMGQDAKIDAVVNSFQMTGTGKTVTLSFALPAEVLDLLNSGGGLSHLVK
jgi:hypothetical protein